eukprot:TRINITY_DN5515_c0_g1_i1.p2 TRINITY_DN5515_c0_g1~~TRINITY_DN5515_c0_g1_i1.p2  ORF type:complete len:106 (-),score=27.06 TRINITY_DN5515_c0_g1_i1:75-392(-)
MPLCGFISQYNSAKELASPTMRPDTRASFLKEVHGARVTVRGFIVTDELDMYPQCERDLKLWFQQGKLQAKEDVVVGLENAPRAFMSLFTGANFGKLLIKVRQNA